MNFRLGASLGCCLLASLGMHLASGQSVKAEKPNIIFVLVDDMGWGDLGIHWKQKDQSGVTMKRQESFNTPTLDKMAKEGIQLRRHYSAAPVCAPARASVMLGVHQGNSRVIRNNLFDRPIENNHTLATVLKAAGYDTVAIGKWGIGGGGESKTPQLALPHKRGFNYFYGLLDHLAGHCHYPSETRSVYEAKSGQWNDVTASVPKTAYSTDMFIAKAKQWIENHEKTDPKQPFFMYLALPAPHANLTVAGEPYPQGGGVKGGLHWEEQNGQAGPNTAFAPNALENKDKFIHPDNRKFSKDVAKRHSSMIRRIDEGMADLIKLLQDLKVDNNTLIVFTSDNGPHDEAGADPSHRHGAQDPKFFKSYGMMDGIKRDCWEAGIRVPTIVRWPAGIPSGQISLTPSQFHDWMATFADLAKVSAPARTDGKSLVPTLMGESQKQKQGEVYLEYNYPSATPQYPDFLPEHRGSRRGQQQVVYLDGFKGIRRDVKSTDDDFMIFDTLKDPQEKNNLADSRKDLQARMKAKAAGSRRIPALDGAKTIFDQEQIPAVTVSSTAPGLNARVFKGKFPWVPDFAELKSPNTVSNVKNIKVDMPGAKNRGVELTGYIDVPQDGDYKFYVKTDKGEHSRAFIKIHDTELVDADYGYQPGTEVSSDLKNGFKDNVELPVRLKAGKHPVVIGYVTQSDKPELTLSWSGPGFEKKKIDDSVWSRDLPNKK